MEVIKVKKIQCFEYPVGNYLSIAIECTNQYYIELKKRFKKDITKSDKVAILVRGSSGAIIGTLLSQKIIKDFKKKVYIIYYRKDSEDSHQCAGDGTHHITNKSFVLVTDDFVSEGHTINNIVDKFFEDNDNKVIHCIMAQQLYRISTELENKGGDQIKCLISLE